MQKRKFGDYKPEGISTKTILLAFVFMIFTFIVILYAYSPDLTGRTLLSLNLDQSSYDPGEKITGTINLQLEEGDVLPQKSKIQILINGTQIKCQTKYLCYTGKEVSWHTYNESTETCDVITDDPESECANTGDSTEVILNSEFDSLVSGTTKPSYWQFSQYGIVPSYSYGIENEGTRNSVFLNSISQTGSPGSYGNLSQNFGSRNFLVVSLSASPELVANLNVQNNGTGLIYNATICNTGKVQASNFRNKIEIFKWNDGTAAITTDVIYDLTGNPIWESGYVSISNYSYTLSSLGMGICDKQINYLPLSSLQEGKYRINLSANIDGLYYEDRTNNNVSKEINYVKTYAIDLSAQGLASFLEYDSTKQMYRLKYNVSVCNYGTINLQKINVSFSSTNGTSTNAFSQKYLINSLNANKCNTTIILSNIFFPTNGQNYWLSYYNATLSVDPNNEIPEDNENNNLATSNEKLTPFDLYFVKPSITKINNTWLNYSFWICKKNLTTTGLYVNLTFYRNSQNPSTNTPFQGSGAYFISSTCGRYTKLLPVDEIPACTASPCGSVNPSMKIDANEKLKESSEINNTFYTTLQTTGAEINKYELSSEEDNIKTKELFLDSATNPTLFWTLGYNLIYGSNAYSDSGCAFEIVVDGSGSKELHYFSSLNSACPLPTSTTARKYIPIDAPEMMSNGVTSEWANYSIDLFEDWTAAFSNTFTTDKITGISIKNYGKNSSDYIYGQVIYVDNIKLFRGNAPSENCTIRGKVCCSEGTGGGKYYGEQLDCGSGYSCWEECSGGIELTLKEFISESDSSSKQNLTNGILSGGECSIKTSSGVVGLGDLCIDTYYGGIGQGYASCLDTSSTAQSSCRNWDNTYSVDLSDLDIYAPGQNGTYVLSVLFNYYSQTFASINEDPNVYSSLYESSLIVGAASNYTNYCPSTDYTLSCTINSLGSCIGNSRSYNKTCLYSGTSTACPSSMQITGTEYCTSNYTNPLACFESDWQCDDWTECLDGSQTRTCTKINLNCDPAITNSYIPQQQRACSQELPPETGSNANIGKILLYAGIGLLVVAFGFGVFFLIRFLKSKKSTVKKPEAKEEYPELTGYIKDAKASGMSDQDIKSKLQEAGWPKDIVEKAFKAFK